MSTALLAIDNLCASYGRVPVLKHVSLALPAGGFVAVVGANTAGKSTLLRTISGLLPNASGSIRFDGSEILGKPAHDIPGLGIAHVPEGRHVFAAMSVEENLLLGAYARHRAVERTILEESRERIYAMFPRLRERRRQAAGTLSGGEQQMVAIGRALMLEPRLLLLDEPSHGLAPKVVEELHQALVDIHKSGISILLVEQNTRLALSVADYAYVLQSGEMAFSGKADALLGDARLREAYLGI